MRHKWLLLAIVFLIPAAVYAISSLVPKTYEAGTTLHLQQTTFGSTLFSNQISFSTSTTGEAARLIQTSAVAREQMLEHLADFDDQLLEL
jgi:capsular polysaccharide biosynthesis protein